MDILKQKILFLWADYWLHSLAKVAIKISAAIVICGGAAAPVIHALPPHKPSAQHPISVQSTAHAVVAPVPKPVPAPPQPAAVAVAAAPAAQQAAPAAVPQPKPISPTLPAPGSGAKSLAPSTTTPPPSSTSTSSSASPAAAPPAATGGYTSTNWSGYVATSGSFTALTGSWKAPAATGNGSSTTADSTWIGIGGVSSNDLIQTGTTNIVSASGTVSTYAFYELLPGAALNIPSLTVTAGDNMSAAISETSPGMWLIRITDVTTGQTFTTNVAYTSTHSSAEWIQEDPSYTNGSLVPLDHFGSAVFSGGTATVNGSAATIATANSKPITMVNSSGQAIATPSILSAGGFTVTQN